MSAISVLTYVIGLLSLSLACPDGWALNSANDLCYIYISSLTTFEDAVKDCARYGATIPMVKNKGENTFLHNLIKHDTSLRGLDGIWLDGSDRVKEKTWLWNNGDVIQWTYWYPGNPNDANYGEDCLSLALEKGAWTDVACDNSMQIKHVCVKPRNEVCYAGDITKYDGKTSNTESGRLCQRWDTNNPHTKWPKYTASADNYCRYTDDEVAPWCYTTDPDKRWEYCVIPTCSECPKGWTLNRANYICYIYINALTTYEYAVKNCQRLGAVLPMAKNKRENAYLYNFIKHDPTLRSYHGIWLDATDYIQEGEWVWVDGEDVQWTNWSPGSPNNAGLSEHCVTLGTKGLWHDVRCGEHDAHRHVCVKPPGQEMSSARMISQVHHNRPPPNPNPNPYRPPPVPRYSPVHHYSSYRRSQKVNTDETNAAMLKLSRMIEAIKKRMAARNQHSLQSYASSPSSPKRFFRKDH